MAHSHCAAPQQLQADIDRMIAERDGETTAA
jgi:hypothetical protein